MAGKGTLKAAFCFSGIRLLAATGWQMSLRTLGILVTVSGGAYATVTLAMGVFFLRLIRNGLLLIVPDVGTSSSEEMVTNALAVLALAACFYVTVAALAREALSSRRLAVRFSANRSLYRALDIPMHHVFLAESAPRAILLFAICGALCTSAWVAITETGTQSASWGATLVSAPFAAASSWLALSSYFAATDPRRWGWGKGFALLVVGVFLTGLLGATIAVVVRAMSVAPKITDLPFSMAGSAAAWLGGGIGLAAVGLSRATIHNIHALRSHSFPIGLDGLRSGAGIKPTRMHSSPRHLLWLALAKGLVEHKASVLWRGLSLSLILGAAMAAGFRWIGGGPEALSKLPGVHGLAAGAVFMLSIVGVEIIARQNSVAGLLPRLRFVWEAGFSAHLVTWAVVLTQSLLLTLIIGPAMAALLWSLTGELSPQRLLIPWAVAASSVLGGSLSRISLRQADGSAESSLAAAFLTVMFAVPSVLGMVQGNAISVVLTLIYTLILTGGSQICLKSRVAIHR